MLLAARKAAKQTSAQWKTGMLLNRSDRFSLINQWSWSVTFFSKQHNSNQRRLHVANGDGCFLVPVEWLYIYTLPPLSLEVSSTDVSVFGVGRDWFGTSLGLVWGLSHSALKSRSSVGFRLFLRLFVVRNTELSSRENVKNIKLWHKLKITSLIFSLFNWIY